MRDNHASYKYASPYKSPFMITQCQTNDTVTLQCVMMQIRYNIRCIKPHESGTNIEGINLKLMVDNATLVNYLLYNF